MATFAIREMVDLSEVKPAGKVSTPRDLSYLEPYKEAIRALVDAGPGKAYRASVDPAETKTERLRIRAAARALNVVVGVKFEDGKSIMAFWIDTAKAVEPSAYDKLSAEAKARGLTVKALREEKAAEKVALAAMNGETVEPSRRGRPARNGAGAQPELAVV